MDKASIKDLEVEKQLDYKDIVVKLYKVPFKHKCNRNIMAENRQGKILWQVNDISPNEDAPFTNIMPYSSEKILAYNWIGAYCYINISNGEIEIPRQRLW